MHEPTLQPQGEALLTPADSRVAEELHDLLAAIRCHGALIAAQPSDAEIVRRQAHDLTRAADRALELVDLVASTEARPASCVDPGADVAVTCIVADDHPSVLAALSGLLRSRGVEVVGEARDGPGALDLVERLQPRIAILDARMPGLGGLEVARLIAERAPETAVVIFSGFADPRLLEEALDAGARGVVVKEAPLVDLIRAVELVAAGQTYVHPEVRAGSARARVTRLTQREQEVLGLAANGLTNADIAGRLSISSETVQTHVRKAMGKLDAGSRTQAVAKALRLALIE